MVGRHKLQQISHWKTPWRSFQALEAKVHMCGWPQRCPNPLIKMVELRDNMLFSSFDPVDRPLGTWKEKVWVQLSGLFFYQVDVKVLDPLDPGKAILHIFSLKKSRKWASHSSISKNKEVEPYHDSTWSCLYGLLQGFWWDLTHAMSLGYVESTEGPQFFGPRIDYAGSKFFIRLYATWKKL